MGGAGLLLIAWLQGGVGGSAAAWSATPSRATVGDTIRIERFFAAPTGWRVRATKLESQRYLDALADPVALRAPGGWIVRYTVVAWSPGRGRAPMPPVVLLGPGGQVDSLAGDSASITVISVLGDSAGKAAPRAALTPLRHDARNPLPVVAGGAVAAALLAGGVGLRRRRPRKARPPAPVPVEPEVRDARWVAAGEPRAVAARAAGRLRAAIARAVPAAHPALSTAECVAALAQARPEARVRDVAALLAALDQVEFAAAHGADVNVLAERARALSRELSA